MKKLAYLVAALFAAALSERESNASDGVSKAARDHEYVRKMIPEKISGKYEGGALIVMRVQDRNAYLVKPTGKSDAQKRWVWIFPFWLGVNDGHGRLHHRLYVEKYLAAGFSVAGIDVGTSCGSPAAAAVCHRLLREAQGRVRPELAGATGSAEQRRTDWLCLGFSPS